MARVLIVDNDQDLLIKLTDEVRVLSYEVVTVNSGEDALAELQRNIVDVMIVDQELDGGNGLQLVREAKQVAPHTPTLVLSNSATVKDYKAALEKGALDVLSNPPEPEELEEAISKALECTEGFSGTLHGFSLLDMLQMYHLNRRSLVIRFKVSKEEIHLDKGEIVHASAHSRSGREALVLLLTKSSGALETNPFAAEGPRTISQPFEPLLLDVLREIDENHAAIHSEKRIEGHPALPKTDLSKLRQSESALMCDDNAEPDEVMQIVFPGCMSDQGREFVADVTPVVYNELVESEKQVNTSCLEIEHKTDGAGETNCKAEERLLSEPEEHDTVQGKMPEIESPPSESAPAPTSTHQVLSAALQWRSSVDENKQKQEKEYPTHGIKQEDRIPEPPLFSRTDSCEISLSGEVTARLKMHPREKEQSLGEEEKDGVFSTENKSDSISVQHRNEHLSSSVPLFNHAMQRSSFQEEKNQADGKVNEKTVALRLKKVNDDEKTESQSLELFSNNDKTQKEPATNSLGQGPEKTQPSSDESSMDQTLPWLQTDGDTRRQKDVSAVPEKEKPIKQKRRRTPSGRRSARQRNATHAGSAGQRNAMHAGSESQYGKNNDEQIGEKPTELLIPKKPVTSPVDPSVASTLSVDTAGSDAVSETLSPSTGVIHLSDVIKPAKEQTPSSRWRISLGALLIVAALISAYLLISFPIFYKKLNAKNVPQADALSAKKIIRIRAAKNPSSQPLKPALDEQPLIKMAGQKKIRKARISSAEKRLRVNQKQIEEKDFARNRSEKYHRQKIDAEAKQTSKRKHELRKKTSRSSAAVGKRPEGKTIKGRRPQVGILD